MKKHEIIFSLLKLPLDFLIIFLSFFIARDLREINDFVPWVQLPIQIIHNEYLLKFAIFGAFLYLIIFSIHGLYSLKITASKLKETFDILLYSIYFFLFFSVFVYFGKWVFYNVEIPRLVILFTTLIGVFWIITERIILNKIQNFLLDSWYIPKRNILIVTSQWEKNIHHILDDIQEAHIYNIIWYINKAKTNAKLPYLWNAQHIWDILEKNPIDEILYIDSDFNSDELYQIWDFSRIYGIRYRYITNSFDVTKSNTTVSLLNKIPVVEIKNTALWAWWRVLKRWIDLIGSIIWIIISLPLFIIVGILIKWEDPDGPIIYKNLRVGQTGKKFNLYKFRYLKWKYCIKESYGVDNNKDEALAFEKKLIAEKSSRHGPLYKIKDDPRKTKIWNFIEKYSIDELPQLFNVFLWNMSLVWPRPHQPREVQNYLLHQKRVLTIKPGITGLAQVNGREKNTFEDEVNLDVFYIENWSFLLDVKIFLKTFWIILNRK